MKASIKTHEMQRTRDTMVLSPNWYFFNLLLHPSIGNIAEETLERCNSQGNRKSDMRLHLLTMSRKLHSWSLISVTAYTQPEQRGTQKTYKHGRGKSHRVWSAWLKACKPEKLVILLGKLLFFMFLDYSIILSFLPSLSSFEILPCPLHFALFQILSHFP